MFKNILYRRYYEHYMVSAVIFLYGEKLKKWEIALIVSICVAMCWGVLFEARTSELAERVIRLHVIAVSDSDGEQAVKMHVRDAVLEYLEPVVSAAESAGDAQSAIAGRLDGIKAAAEEAAEGRAVTVQFGKAAYAARRAEGYMLPAGEYTSLRVTLGEGGGHNWWGVIFPQLTAGEYTDEQAIEALGEKNAALIADGDGGCEIKFKLLEWLGNLTQWQGFHSGS